MPMNSQAKSLLEAYAIFKDGVRWLRNAVHMNLSKYVKKYMIPTMTAPSLNIEERRRLIRNFVYLSNVFLLDYDFWLTGKVNGIKFHLQETLATDNTNQNSQHKLLTRSNPEKFKKSNDNATCASIETMDLELNTFSMADVFTKLIELKQLLQEKCPDVVITSNEIALDVFEKEFIISYKTDKETETKVDISRIKFNSRGEFHCFVKKVLVDDINYDIIERSTLSKKTISNDLSKLTMPRTTEIPKKRNFLTVYDENDNLSKMPEKWIKVDDDNEGEGDDAENEIGKGIKLTDKKVNAIKPYDENGEAGDFSQSPSLESISMSSKEKRIKVVNDNEGEGHDAEDKIGEGLKNILQRKPSSTALLQKLKKRKNNSSDLQNFPDILKSDTSVLLKSSVHQKPNTSDLLTYTFKVLTAGSLKGNENILHEFIQGQLKAEYENSESTLIITFEMVLHYIKSNVSFASFIHLVENDAISYKDKLLEKLKSEQHFKQLSVTKQEKIVSDYYSRARSFIAKIGTLLYTFLKDYYIASTKNNFDYFFCQYSFMTTNISILSADMIKCVIDKVYKEDYILIEAQKRSGLLSIAQNGLLGSVLQTDEVKSFYKAGQYEKMHSLIQTQIQAHGHTFSLPDKKKAHIQRILRELTSEDNPFPSCEYDQGGLNNTDTVISNENQTPTGSVQEKNENQTPTGSLPEKNASPNDSEQNVFLQNQMHSISSLVEQFIKLHPSVTDSDSKFLCETMECLNKFFSISDLRKAICSIESNAKCSSAFLIDDEYNPQNSCSSRTPDLNIIQPPISGTSSEKAASICTGFSDLNTSIESGVSSLGISPSWSSKTTDLSTSSSEKAASICTGFSDLHTSIEAGVSSLGTIPDEKLRKVNEELLDKNGLLELEGDGRNDFELSDDFYYSLIKINGVRTIHVTYDGLDGNENESSLLLSAILTILLHSISLLYFAEPRVKDWKYHRQLLRVIQNLDKEHSNRPWAYDTVLNSLSLNPVSFSHQNVSSSTFDFGKCVESFITANSLIKGGLRCFGTIDLALCSDLNSFHAQIEDLYQQSIKNDQSKDNALTFISVKRNSGFDKLSVKSVSHAFIIKSNPTEICLQLFAALYSTITGRMKVVLVTRSVDISFFDSDYFIYEYDIPNDSNNSPRLERVNSPSRSSDAQVFTFLPGGYSLFGLVYGQSLSQISTAKKNPYTLTREIKRRNDFAKYGRDEMNILSSSSEWLKESILNSLFGLACRFYANDSSPSQDVISSQFLHWLLAPQINEISIKKYAPKIDIHDSSLNAYVHIPVNYPQNIHWMYILLHVQKKTIYYMDSLSSNQNGELIAEKLNTFFESEFNAKQHLGTSNRRKCFIKWATKRIQSPLQQDGDNCGIFTIMNMVRTAQNIKEKRYLTNTNHSTKQSLTPLNLNKARQIIKDIMFESESVEKLSNFVKNVYF